MDNPRLLKLQINDKLDELEKLKDTNLRYDTFENPAKLLEHYKEELKFFDQGKQSLARMMDTKKNEEEHSAFEMLTEFYLNTYPKLELELLRVIEVLKNKLKNSN